MYGGAHSAVLAARLLGLLATRLWRAAAEEPIVTAILAALGLIYAIANPAETVEAARRMIETLKAQGTRLLELSEPAFERRAHAEGQVASRLEAPILPRSVESACARALALRAGPLCTEDLVNAAGPRSLTAGQLARYLCAHPSFTLSTRERWDLGELGMPVIDAPGDGCPEGSG